ncbi:MAG: copper resistance CopC family protein [Actinomycetota bacterium]
MRRLTMALATASLFIILGAPAATAAPRVIESDPPDGATEHKAPDTVSITFDMPLDEGSSVIKVVDECGRQIDAKNTQVELNEMHVGIALKPAGVYKAYYYANPPAGATGSSNGVITFTVHAGPSCGPGASDHEHGAKTGGHGNHERSGHEAGGGQGAHEGHDDGSTGHSGMTSGHTDHTSTSTHGGTHSAAAGGHGGHTPSAAGHGRHKGGDDGNDNNVNAAGGGRAPAPRAALDGPVSLSDGEAILVSLGACLLLGLAGGWLIRTTQPPRKPA